MQEANIIYFTNLVKGIKIIYMELLICFSSSNYEFAKSHFIWVFF